MNYDDHHELSRQIQSLIRENVRDKSIVFYPGKIRFFELPESWDTHIDKITFALSDEGGENYLSIESDEFMLIMTFLLDEDSASKSKDITKELSLWSDIINTALTRSSIQASSYFEPIVMEHDFSADQHTAMSFVDPSLPDNWFGASFLQTTIDPQNEKYTVFPRRTIEEISQRYQDDLYPDFLERMKKDKPALESWEPEESAENTKGNIFQGDDPDPFDPPIIF